MKPEDRWFYRGMACAAAVLVRRDEPFLAVECLESNGVTLDMLREARVEPFDLGPLAKAWRSEHPEPAPSPSGTTPSAPPAREEQTPCPGCGERHGWRYDQGRRVEVCKACGTNLGTFHGRPTTRGKE